MLPNGTGNDFGRNLGFRPAGPGGRGQGPGRGPRPHRGRGASGDAQCLGARSGTLRAPALPEPHRLRLRHRRDRRRRHAPAFSRASSSTRSRRSSSSSAFPACGWVFAAAPESAGTVGTSCSPCPTAATSAAAFQSPPRRESTTASCTPAASRTPRRLTRLSLFNLAEKGRHVTLGACRDPGRRALPALLRRPAAIRDGRRRPPGGAPSELEVRILPRALRVVAPGLHAPTLCVSAAQST